MLVYVHPASDVACGTRLGGLGIKRERKDQHHSSPLNVTARVRVAASVVFILVGCKLQRPSNALAIFCAACFA